MTTDTLTATYTAAEVEEALMEVLDDVAMLGHDIGYHDKPDNEHPTPLDVAARVLAVLSTPQEPATTTRKRSPREVPCPSCDAKPGEDCWVYHNGRHGSRHASAAFHLGRRRLVQ